MKDNKKRVIIAALGKAYLENKDELNRQYNVIGVLDKIRKVEEKKWINISNICTCKFDYVVITSMKFFFEIRKELIEAGVDEKKIIGTDAINVCIADIKTYDGELDRRDRTSGTDDELYSLVCLASAENEQVFSHFRNNLIYINTLEHVSYVQGTQYLVEMEQCPQKEFSNMEWKNILRNDLYGGGVRYAYDICNETLNVSPNTIRYAKVLQDILINFEGINSIVEIGVGYGGQCRIITSLISTILTYDLIDLPEALKLAKKYIEHFEECTGKVNYINGIELEEKISCDLVISNYAFSELKKYVQDSYFNNVLSNAKHGYITWNRYSENNLDGYSLEEILDKLGHVKVIPERPLTSRGNCIIIW